MEQSGPATRLKKKWDLLKALDEKHEIDRLRLRADVAECIRDCYGSGMRRVDVAKLLGVTDQRVTRLLQGNWRATEASVRRNPENYRLAYVEAEVKEVFIERPTEEQIEEAKLKKCLYCSQDAAFVVEWENKQIYVCAKHKPPEV